jgi:asparagine synthase (glutamine-hydrolysing)
MSLPLCLFHRNGQAVTAPEMATWLAALPQQGPHGRAYQCNGPVGLGHMALLETPEMRGEQQPAPLDKRIDAAAPANLLISADVRLDNRAELAAKLQIDNALLAQLGDSQLILAAYWRWGEACLPQLLGDFAFIIWDGPQRKLFCGRDALGVKPLYTYERPDLFLAAGDVRALVAHPQGPRCPDVQSLAYYFEEYMLADPARTYLEQVRVLLPAHSLTVGTSQSVLRRYWFPDQIATRQIASLEQAAEELRALLEDAVRVRLRRVEGVVAHMSGGLDSTSVAYLAARQLAVAGESLATYSWQPVTREDAILATSEYAPLQAALRPANLIHANIAHTTVNLTAADFAQDIALDICLHHSQNFVYEAVVRQTARRQQVRVILSGWGGDELITSHGAGYVKEMFWRGRWDKLAAFLRARPAPRGKNPLRHHLGTLFRNIVTEPLPRLPLGAATTEKHTRLPAYLVPSAPELAAHLAHLPPIAYPRRSRQMREYRLALLRYGHLHRRMESWAAGGADEQIVYRYPLLDRRVVELALALPAEAFVHGRHRRYLMRRAMSGILPDEVCWGQSKLEPVRVEQWLALTQAALLPVLDATIGELPGPSRFEIEPLRRHLARAAADTTYTVGDVERLMRAIQVLGAGRHLPAD